MQLCLTVTVEPGVWGQLKQSMGDSVNSWIILIQGFMGRHSKADLRVEVKRVCCPLCWPSPSTPESATVDLYIAVALEVPFAFKK